MASDVNCCSECTVAKLDHDGAVKVGDVILSEDPWVYTLSEFAIDQRCYRCLGLLRENHGQKQQPVNRCSGCSYVRYCSTECQRQDWKESYRHKLECAVLKQIRSKAYSPPQHFMLVLKIIARIQAKDEKSSAGTYVRCAFPIRPEKTYARLISHAESVKQNPVVMDYIERLYVALSYYFGSCISNNRCLPRPPSMEETIEMVGKVRANTFGIMDQYSLQPCATGLYMQAASLDHSCQPNACQSFFGRRLVVRASTYIRDFTNVRVSYLDLMMPLTYRQRLLRDVYSFSCNCVRCSRPQREAEGYGMRCGNPACFQSIPSDKRADNPCPRCQHQETTQSRRKRYAELIEKIHERLFNVHRPFSNLTEKDGLRLLAEAKEMIHPDNPLLAALSVNVAEAITANATEKDRDKREKSSCELFVSAIETYRKWLPVVNSERPYMLVKAARNMHLWDDEWKAMVLASVSKSHKSLSGQKLQAALRSDYPGPAFGSAIQRAVQTMEWLMEAKESIELLFGRSHPLYEEVVTGLQILGHF